LNTVKNFTVVISLSPRRERDRVRGMKLKEED